MKGRTQGAVAVRTCKMYIKIRHIPPKRTYNLHYVQQVFG